MGDVVRESAQRTVDAARAEGGDSVAMVLDISSEADVAQLVELAMSTYGRIDGLFNVAANIEPDQVAADTDVVDIDVAVWQRMLDVNLTGYMLACKHALPRMIASGGGAVINTISDAVYAGMPDKVAYQATKAGVSAMTRHIARRFGKDGIRANSSLRATWTETTCSRVGLTVAERPEPPHFVETARPAPGDVDNEPTHRVTLAQEPASLSRPPQKIDGSLDTAQGP